MIQGFKCVSKIPTWLQGALCQDRYSNLEINKFVNFTKFARGTMIFSEKGVVFTDNSAWPKVIDTNTYHTQDFSIRHLLLVSVYDLHAYSLRPSNVLSSKIYSGYTFGTDDANSAGQNIYFPILKKDKRVFPYFFCLICLRSPICVGKLFWSCSTQIIPWSTSICDVLTRLRHLK